MRAVDADGGCERRLRTADSGCGWRMRTADADGGQRTADADGGWRMRTADSGQRTADFKINNNKIYKKKLLK